MKHLFTILLCVVALSGCFKFEPAKEAVFKPGEDPLADAIFRKLLDQAEIGYTIREDGFYISEKSNLEKMKSLSREAYSQINKTSEVQLSGECARHKISEILIGVTFVTYEKSGELYIRSTSSAFDENNIMGKVVATQRECDEAFNKANH